MKILSIKTMNFCFILFQVILGYDYGFFDYKSRLSRLIGKVLCFLQCSIICLFMFFYADLEPMDYTILGWMRLYWYIFYLVQYMTYVLIFIFCRHDLTLFKFQCATKVIDMKLKSPNAYNSVEKRKMLTFALFVVYRFFICWYYCYFHHEYCLRPVWVSVCYLLILSCMDLVLVSNTFLFYSIYYRLAILMSNLRSAHNQVTHFQNVYKIIVDVAEKFKSAYDLVFMMALLFNVPLMMVSIFGVVWDTHKTYGSPLWMVLLRIENVAVLTNVAVTLFPAVLAGKLCKQADKIRVILHDKLLFERDELECSEINKFIRYVEARPFKFTVYKVIPLDANLIRMVVHFAVTYLIVVIQFTHLF